MANVAWTDRFAAPLDGVRRSALVQAANYRFVRSILSSKNRRVAWIMGAHACVALPMTVLFPAPLLVLVPLVLGVPHVVADLRYLVLRRGLGPRARVSILFACGAFVAVAALGLMRVRFDVAKVEVGLGIGVLAVTCAVALASRSGAWSATRAAGTALVLGGLALLGRFALGDPRRALVVLIHAHNGVALVVWLCLFRTRIRSVLPALSLVAAGAVLLASGALIPATLQIGVWRAFGTNLLAAADWLAPGVPDPIAVGLASSFVFLQSVHYLVWLVLVPSDARSGSGSVSFRRGLRDLVRDLGGLGAMAALSAWVLVLGFGAAAPLATKNAYLALASFHVWLEIAVLTYWVAAGRAISFRTPVAA